MKPLSAALAAIALAAAARAAELPPVYSYCPEVMAAALAAASAGDPALRPALDRLRQDADEALKFRPVSVMDKSRVPPSGDRHDYISQAPYYWPDPKNPKGPYIRHDGLRNPERLVGSDYPPLLDLARAVDALGVAYYFFHDERCAEHAARLMRVWFLDPATRMNPNINFGQFIPGRTLGREEGVLEFRHLMGMMDTLGLISDSPAWTAADRDGFHRWLAAYSDWLANNRLGRTESAARNNHGTWADAQRAHILLFLGRTDEARRLIEEAFPRRIATQVEPDGRQPLELGRTKALNYSLLNLEGLCNLARLGTRAGYDGWSFATPDGRSLMKAVAFVAPYADPAAPWMQSDLVAADRSRIPPILAEALRHGGDPAWNRLVERFGSRDGRWRLTGVNAATRDLL